MQDSTSVMFIHRHEVGHDASIPGQSRLIKSLGLDPKRKEMDPVTIHYFQETCKTYEEYLMIKVAEAVTHMMSDTKKYKHRRYVIVKVDLADGSKDEVNNLVMPFHMAHYGLQYPDKEGTEYWTRRNKQSWAACGIRNQPFTVVQERLWRMGYVLVDMSLIGTKPQLRLYYRGPPTMDDYVDCIDNACDMHVTDCDPSMWFWHKKHQIKMAK